MDELQGYNVTEGDWNNRLCKWFALLILCAILFLSIMMVFTSGCVTLTKKYAFGITPTPTPTIAPITTPEPNETPILEPTPVPTTTLTKEQEALWMLQTNGYFENDWHNWYREDVSGKQDMIIRATVYDHRFMKSYHWRDFSWGSRATRKETAYKDNKFLFVFIRMESIGTSEKTWGFGRDNWVVQVNDTIIAPDDETNPVWIIKELENTWTRDHLEMPGPYSYKRVQEAGSGVMTAEQLEWLKNDWPWDGYMVFQVPDSTTEEDVKVIGRFDNVGGTAYWQLTKG